MAQVPAGDDGFGPRFPATSFAGSVMVHALLLVLALLWTRERPLGLEHALHVAPVHLFLGYPGPPHFSPLLEAIDPNAARASISQRPRAGRAHPPATTPGSWRLPRNPGRLPVPIGEPGRGTPATTAAGPEPLPALQAPIEDFPTSDELQIVRLVKPIYPEYELSHRIRGLLVVAARVTFEGTLDDVQIEEASATPAGASTHAFELAVLEALGRWQLRLPLRYAHDQGFWIRFPVEFTPDDSDFRHLESIRLK